MEDSVIFFGVFLIGCMVAFLVCYMAFASISLFLGLLFGTIEERERHSEFNAPESLNKNGNGISD